MILHPDGRIEGTPAELASYQKLTIGTKVPIPVIEPLPYTIPNPYRDVSPSPRQPWQPRPAPNPWAPNWTCGGSATYKPNPNIIAYN